MGANNCKGCKDYLNINKNQVTVGELKSETDNSKLSNTKEPRKYSEVVSRTRKLALDEDSLIVNFQYKLGYNNQYKMQKASLTNSSGSLNELLYDDEFEGLNNISTKKDLNKYRLEVGHDSKQKTDLKQIKNYKQTLNTNNDKLNDIKEHEYKEYRIKNIEKYSAKVRYIQLNINVPNDNLTKSRVSKRSRHHNDFDAVQQIFHNQRSSIFSMLNRNPTTPTLEIKYSFKSIMSLLDKKNKFKLDDQRIFKAATKKKSSQRVVSNNLQYSNYFDSINNSVGQDESRLNENLPDCLLKKFNVTQLTNEDYGIVEKAILEKFPIIQQSDLHLIKEFDCVYNVEPNTIITSRDLKEEFLLIIVSGSINFFKKNQYITTFKSGDVFGNFGVCSKNFTSGNTPFIDKYKAYINNKNSKVENKSINKNISSFIGLDGDEIDFDKVSNWFIQFVAQRRSKNKEQIQISNTINYHSKKNPYYMLREKVKVLMIQGENLELLMSMNNKDLLAKQNIVNEFPYIKHLSETFKQQIANCIVFESINNTNRYIASKGEVINKFYFVVEGKIIIRNVMEKEKDQKEYKTENNLNIFSQSKSSKTYSPSKEQLIASFGPGESFNEDFFIWKKITLDKGEIIAEVGSLLATIDEKQMNEFYFKHINNSIVTTTTGSFKQSSKSTKKLKDKESIPTNNLNNINVDNHNQNKNFNQVTAKYKSSNKSLKSLVSVSDKIINKEVNSPVKRNIHNNKITENLELNSLMLSKNIISNSNNENNANNNTDSNKNNKFPSFNFNNNVNVNNNFNNNKLDNNSIVEEENKDIVQISNYYPKINQYLQPYHKKAKEKEGTIEIKVSTENLLNKHFSYFILRSLFFISVFKNNFLFNVLANVTNNVKKNLNKKFSTSFINLASNTIKNNFITQEKHEKLTENYDDIIKEKNSSNNTYTKVNLQSHNSSFNNNNNILPKTKHSNLKLSTKKINSTNNKSQNNKNVEFQEDVLNVSQNMNFNIKTFAEILDDTESLFEKFTLHTISPKSFDIKIIINQKLFFIILSGKIYVRNLLTEEELEFAETEIFGNSLDIYNERNHYFIKQNITVLQANLFEIDQLNFPENKKDQIKKAKAGSEDTFSEENIMKKSFMKKLISAFPFFDSLSSATKSQIENIVRVNMITMNSDDKVVIKENKEFIDGIYYLKHGKFYKKKYNSNLSKKDENFEIIEYSQGEIVGLYEVFNVDVQLEENRRKLTYSNNNNSSSNFNSPTVDKQKEKENSKIITVVDNKYDVDYDCELFCCRKSSNNSSKGKNNSSDTFMFKNINQNQRHSSDERSKNTDSNEYNTNCVVYIKLSKISLMSILSEKVYNYFKDYLFYNKFIRYNTVVNTLIMEAKLHPTNTITSELRIIAELGKGAFGVVFLVNFRNVIYALKIITHNYLMSKARLRNYFSQEIENSINVVSPFKIDIRALFYNNFSVNYIMNYSSFLTLRSLMTETLNDGYLLSIKRVKEIFINLVIALDTLHQKSIIHRDIKPENIIVREDGYLTLIDFGLSIKIKYLTSSIVGSPYYMSPEQIKGLSYGKSADYWSIGVILFELLYGYNPFKKVNDCSAVDVYSRIINIEEVKFPAIRSQTKKIIMKDSDNNKEDSEFELMKKLCKRLISKELSKRIVDLMDIQKTIPFDYSSITDMSYQIKDVISSILHLPLKYFQESDVNKYLKFINKPLQKNNRLSVVEAPPQNKKTNNNEKDKERDKEKEKFRKDPITNKDFLLGLEGIKYNENLIFSYLQTHSDEVINNIDEYSYSTIQPYYDWLYSLPLSFQTKEDN